MTGPASASAVGDASNETVGGGSSEQSRSSRSYLHRLQAQVAVARGDLAAAYEQLDLAYQAGGGTAVLIMIGVGLDTVKQIESQLMQRNYEGFLK